MKPLFNPEVLKEAAVQTVAQNTFALLTPKGPSMTTISYHCVLGVAEILTGSKKAGAMNIATGVLLGAIKCTKNEKVRSMLAMGVGVTSTAASVASVKTHGLGKHVAVQTAGALTCFTIDTINNYVDLEDKPKQ